MQCTAQEIEEKRKQAQEKLLIKKNLISSINQNSSNLLRYGSDGSFINKSSSNLLNNTSNSSASPKTLTFKSDGPKSPFKFLKTNNSFNFKPYDKAKQTSPFGKNNIVTGTCALISEDRFTVELSGYSAPAIEVFKTIPSKIYSKLNMQTYVYY